MFSVIFEVNPRRERFDDYLDNAKTLKPLLEQIEGFIDNERFESRTRDGWLLSHSTWRDEKAVVRWRTTPEHHAIQEAGRNGIFADYHLRVGDVVADSAPPSGYGVDQQRFDETEVGTAKYATLTELVPDTETALMPQAEMIPAHLGLDARSQGLIARDLFTSIYTPGKIALLLSWERLEHARSFAPLEFAGVKELRHRIVRIVRDYGMRDRREAPQYYPEPRAD